MPGPYPTMTRRRSRGRVFGQVSRALRGTGEERRGSLDTAVGTIIDPKVILAMQKDSGTSELELKGDGGAAKNDFLMQFQTDLLGSPVMRPKVVEAAARGGAFLAGLTTGSWKDLDELVDTFELDRKFLPQINDEERRLLYAR